MDEHSEIPRLGEALLTEMEVAAYLAVPINTLRSWRRTGRGPGPDYISLGSSKGIRYEPDAVRRFVEAHRETRSDDVSNPAPDGAQEQPVVSAEFLERLVKKAVAEEVQRVLAEKTDEASSAA